MFSGQLMADTRRSSTAYIDPIAERSLSLIHIDVYKRQGRTRYVLLAIGHLLLLTSAWIIRSPSALPAPQLRQLDEVAAGVLEHGDLRGRHIR